ncbi:MAG: site-specific DNA-methyltransferase [Planctomycetes bacterium]|nr:site-specific DNA-methyltransferase [Planctomycetota bacterium]
MARKKRKKTVSSPVETADYRHLEKKRKNIPPAAIAAEGHVPEVPKAEYLYCPHLPPVLRHDPDGGADALPDLIAEAGRRVLSPTEQRTLADALSSQEPWLEWSEKREQQRRRLFEVDPVALHIHERVSTRAVLRAAYREDVQRELFADPQLPYQQEVKFYQHDIDWTNRLILGDSLQVMSSLARRENLAGKVQMIYLDPPYGIKYKSNFQPLVGRVDVKDKDSDLTRQPEMVKAFRDTWELGVHSYLSYLRDRLIVAKELLADTGSLFVQMGLDNVHRVRALLDEVFGPQNFVSQIAFVKTTSSTSKQLSSVYDQILWYRKTDQMKYRPIFLEKRPGETGATGYKTVLLRSGETLPSSRFIVDGALQLPEGADLIFADNYTSQSPGSRYDVLLDGRTYRPEPGYWKTDEGGMARILKAGRLGGSAKRKYPGYLRRISDFSAYPLGNVWTDTLGQNQFGGKKCYATQTALKVIQRCMHMTTDPGDLVLDPTCGSGTTALLAE